MGSLESLNLKELAEKLMEVRDKEDELEESLKELGKLRATIEDLMVGEMINEGASSVKYSDVGSFSLTTQDFPAIVDDTKFFKYLSNTGQEAMAKYTVNANTLRGWWNKKIDVDLKPEDIGLSIHTKTKLNVRKV